VARRSKQPRTERRRQREEVPKSEGINPLEDVFESGGELYLAVGYTPGGFPFGPRVEVVDGELRFPDDELLDLRAEI
jgi:hypothetical protein